MRQIHRISAFILLATASLGAFPADQWDIGYRTAAGTGPPSPGKISELPEETAPAGGDMLLGEESGGALRKFDVSHFVGPDVVWLAASDETTALATGTAKLSVEMPQAFAIDTATDSGIGCSVVTAPTTSGIAIDVNEAGTSIMTTNKVAIDPGENNSQDAATAPGVTDSALAKGAIVTIDIDAVGSGTAGAGLKCWLIGGWQ